MHISNTQNFVSMHYLFNQNNLASNNINKINWSSLAHKKDLIKPIEEPYTKGTNEVDNFVLGAAEKGTIQGKAGDDTFDYKDELGTQNTRLVGGLGNDTLVFSKLTTEQALDALQKNGYTFAARHNGFILRTKDNQEIQVSAENIKFSDKCFNLQDDKDLASFIKALEDKCIPILNETHKPVFSQYTSEINNSIHYLPANGQVGNQQAYYSAYPLLNQLNPNENALNQTNLNGLTLNSLTSQNENINGGINPSLRANNLDLSNSINTSNIFNFVGFAPNHQLRGLTGSDPYWLLNASS